ncbi:MAG: hypothetical protein ACI9K1_002613 [Arcticibacterium sp.]|jgi:hypothetical protein
MFIRHFIISIFCILGTHLYAQESGIKRLQKVDSIPLFSDLHYYSFFFSEKYDSDTILGVNYPLLNLDVLSKKGKYLGEITRRGAGLGLLGTSTFIDISTGDSGDIYVLRQDNAYSVYVYDYKGMFKKQVRLFLAEPDYSSPIFYSNFKVLEEPENNQLRFFLSVASSIESRFSKKYYRDNSGILEFILDSDSFTIQETKKHLPYLENAEILQAISENEISWNYPYPNFDFSDNHFYVIYSFSKFLFQYDKSFQLVRKSQIQSLPELSKSYSIGFTTGPKEFEKQRVIDARLQFENVNAWNIQVRGKKALIQLFEPKEFGKYPILSSEQAKNFETINLNSIIIVKDLVSGKEDIYRLDKAFQGRVRLISETEFLVQGIPDPSVEEIYLYKFKLK